VAHFDESTALMILPNAENAFVDLEKLTHYCLSAKHPRGKHKARVFEAACGITENEAGLLQQQLLEAAESGEAMETASDTFGRRFVIEYTIRGPTGLARLRTAWIILHDENFPRFVSAYVI
jgi:hypothetical protein